MQDHPTSSAIVEETERYGVRLRRHSLHPAFLVSDDGRALGARGYWLKASRQTSGHRYLTYIDTDGKQQYIHLHRLVVLCYVPNPDPETLTKVDHRDSNPDNNHHTNLRWVTPRQNCQNLVKNKTGATSSKYIGVGWHKKDQRWRAQIRLNGKNRGLGNFRSEVDAAKAYDNTLVAAGLAPVNFPITD